MAEDHVVESGDCLTSIAFEHGFDWQTLWNHPDNADLKAKRKDPNVLLAGDVVHVPDRKPKDLSLATGKRHEMVIRGAAMLRLRIVEPKPAPAAPAAGSGGGGGGGGPLGALGSAVAAVGGAVKAAVSAILGDDDSNRYLRQVGVELAYDTNASVKDGAHAVAGMPGIFRISVGAGVTRNILDSGHPRATQLNFLPRRPGTACSSWPTTTRSCTNRGEPTPSSRRRP